MNLLSRRAAPLLPLLLSLASVAVQAQTAPDSGSILRQINPPLPQAPSPSGTGLQVEGQPAARVPAGPSFDVTRIAITGNTVFDAATLHALVADAEGRRLDLAQLGQVAARISEYYRSRGYPLARAIIPAQTVRGGTLTIEVIEARYGTVKLDNRSRAATGLLQQTLVPLQAGQPVYQPDLDRALLLLGDVPGVAVGATLAPGDAVGTSRLAVEADATARVAGYASVENYGNPYTGRTRASGGVSVANPLGIGDLFSANALSSGEGLNYARVGYEAVLNGRGTRAGGDVHAVRYKLAGSLEPLGAHGDAVAGVLFVKHPLLRSRDANVYGQVQYESRQLRDRVDAGSLRNDRHLDDWTLAFNGDWRDGWLSSSVSTWSLGWTNGQLRFDDAAAQAADALSANTRGSFGKWNGSFSRAQALGAADTLYLAGTAQWTHENLDSSEKLSVGGPNSVRAYRLGAVSADRGYVATAELRHLFGTSVGGRWQGVAFVDAAHVTVNSRSWAAGANSGTLKGAGLGLEWFGPQLWRVKAAVASRLGSRPAIVEDQSHTRGWIEVSKAF